MHLHFLCDNSLLSDEINTELEAIVQITVIALFSIAIQKGYSEYIVFNSESKFNITASELKESLDNRYPDLFNIIMNVYINLNLYTYITNLLSY